MLAPVTADGAPAERTVSPGGSVMVGRHAVLGKEEREAVRGQRPGMDVNPEQWFRVKLAPDAGAGEQR